MQFIKVSSSGPRFAHIQIAGMSLDELLPVRRFCVYSAQFMLGQDLDIHHRDLMSISWLYSMVSSIQLLASSFSPENINLWSRLLCIGIRVSGAGASSGYLGLTCHNGRAVHQWTHNVYI